MMVLYPILRKKGIPNEKVFKIAIAMALTGYGCLLLILVFGFTHNLPIICIPGILVFAANGVLSVLTTVFLSGSVDYGEMKTGRREESVIFSMQTFVVKAASGVAVFLTGVGLDIIGLVGNTDDEATAAVQSASTLMGLRLLMTILPMLGLMLRLLPMLEPRLMLLPLLVLPLMRELLLSKELPRVMLPPEGRLLPPELMLP